VPIPKSSSETELAAYWAEKYGESIDCPELRKCASLEAVQRERAKFASLRILTEFAELLREQWVEQRAFFERSVPGESSSFREHLESERAATGETGARRRAAQMTKLIEFLEGRGDRRAIHAAHFANPAQFLQALQLAERSSRSRTAELLEIVLNRFPESEWAVKTRASDPALGQAAHAVSEWIRKRHQNAKGKPDERTSWPDVVHCLEYHGHDLSQIDTSKADALRHLAKRWQAKQQKS
jgi:hypothetical protein